MQDTRSFITHRNFIVLMGSGIVLTTITGPYHTIENLSLGGRFVYWSLLILIAGFIANFLLMLGRAMNADKRVHWSIVAIIGGLLTAPMVYAATWTLNLMMIGEFSVRFPLNLFFYVAAPIVVINLVVAAALESQDREASQTPDTQADDNAPAAATMPDEVFRPSFNWPQAPLPEMLPPDPAPEPPAPLLIEKLPPELGRDLICLRAQDHYVEVTTPKGSAMVLMRLSDAERDLNDFDGMRVHRSWWINLDHVLDTGRTENGGMEAYLSNGLAVPVSRGQRADLRALLDQRRKAAE